MSTTPMICPGCGEIMHTVGAVAVMHSRCCGGLVYSICAACARTMATASEVQRAELLQKIEMSLAADEGKQQ